MDHRIDLRVDAIKLHILSLDGLLERLETIKLLHEEVVRLALALQVRTFLLESILSQGEGLLQVGTCTVPAIELRSQSRLQALDVCLFRLNLLLSGCRLLLSFADLPLHFDRLLLKLARCLLLCHPHLLLYRQYGLLRRLSLLQRLGLRRLFRRLQLVLQLLLHAILFGLDHFECRRCTCTLLLQLPISLIAQRPPCLIILLFVLFLDVGKLSHLFVFEVPSALLERLLRLCLVEHRPESHATLSIPDAAQTRKGPIHVHLTQETLQLAQ